MDDNSGNEGFRKAFGHVRIVWTVENFCLAVRDADYLICSPEFVVRGDCLTKWKMTLQIGEVISEAVPVLFSLNRLPEISSECSRVVVDCELIVTAGKKRFVAVENTFEFEKNEKRTMAFPSLESVFENFRPLSTDTLKIEFNMVVRGDKDFALDQAPPVGLAALAMDLRDMLVDGFPDVTLEVDGKKLRAHKFMLNRINLFRSMLLRNPKSEGNNLRLPSKLVSHDNLRRFIEFTYTANMLPILNNPSLSMYKFLHDLKCDLLLRYYTPDLLSMNTKIELEEASWFYWKITNFSKRTEDIFSPPLRGMLSEVTWRMCLNPLFSTMNRDFISLFVEVLGLEKPHNICLEFGVLDTGSQIHFPKRIIKTDMNNEKVGFKAFIDWRELESRSLFNSDAIHIVFRPRISSNKKTCSLGSRITSFVTNDERTSYEELSSNMAGLLEDDESDFIIKARGETFYAHTSVIIARCTKLKVLRTPKGVIKSKQLCIPNISVTILKKFLFFIYCGVLKDCQPLDLVQLYRLGEIYGVKGMQTEGIYVF